MLTALRHLTALYAALFMINIHHMSMASLVNYFGDVYGMSKTMLGVITSATYLGFFFGCYMLLPLLKRISYIRAFAVSAASAAICALTISLVVDPILWLVLRMCSGAFIGISQAIGETWLAEVVEKKTKGLLYGIYSLVVYLGLASSQALLYLGDEGIHVSMALSVMTALFALLPICLTKFSEPSLSTESRMMSMRECYQISRLSCIGVILVGACLSSTSLVVIFGRGIELPTNQIVILSAVMFVSSIAFHLPVGLLSDKMGDRRNALLAVCAVVVPIAFLTSVIGGLVSFPLLLLIVFFYAGLLPTVYPLCMALGTDLVSKENVTPFVSKVFQLYFIGGISGPLVTGALMEAFSDQWFFVVPGTLMAVLLALCASSQFMPKLRPLKTGPYMGTTALAGMGSGTPEYVQMQTLEKEDLFVGPLPAETEGEHPAGEEYGPEEPRPSPPGEPEESGPAPQRKDVD